MVITIALMVALTIAVAAYASVPRASGSGSPIAMAPDMPAAFGREMAWLAVRTRDVEALVGELGLERGRPCNWQSGIAAVYEPRTGPSRVFVSPPVDGWTFVVSLALPHPMGKAFADKTTPLILGLGARFPEVQYFFSYPPVDLFAWARVVDGRVGRAFAIGDEGVIWTKGRLTREECALGLKLFDFRGIRGRRGDAGGAMILYPTEAHVQRIAARWSLDPTQLAESSPPGTTMRTGVLADAPAAWRPERLRRRASA